MQPIYNEPSPAIGYDPITFAINTYLQKPTRLSQTDVFGWSYVHPFKRPGHTNFPTLWGYLVFYIYETTQIVSVEKTIFFKLHCNLVIIWCPKSENN